MELLFEDRALILCFNEFTLLVVVDLHLGFESELLKRKGVAFPIQHPIMLKRLTKLIEKYEVDMLYILGDVKHTLGADCKYNWELLPEFLMTLQDMVELYIIPGNHDGNLESLMPRNMKLENVRGKIIKDESTSVGLFHGHAWPSAELLSARMFVIGHNHPTLHRYKMVSAPDTGRPERKRFGVIVPIIIKSKMDKNCVRQCIGSDVIQSDGFGTLISLPSFNELLAGVAVNKSNSNLSGPVFENNCVDFLSSGVYSIDEIYLGTVKSIRQRAGEMV
jgi:putative SbcD/Mre11-related phosphoesterase